MPSRTMHSPCRSNFDSRTFMEGTKFATPEEYAKEVADDFMGRPGPVS